MTCPTCEDGEKGFRMTLPAATLDHVVINARDDMDRAADIYRRLGFTLTERGYHSLGSINHLAMFGTDYLELIAVPEGRHDRPHGPADLPVRPRTAWCSAPRIPPSPTNALAKVGVPIDPPVEFTRPVKVAGKEHDARFRTVRMKAGVVPYGRVYYCHHFTRELVWRDEWRHHANGTVAVVRALIVEPDPAAGAKLYADMFGVEAVRDIKGGKSVVIANSRFDIVTEAELEIPVRRCRARCRRPQGLYGRPRPSVPSPSPRRRGRCRKARSRARSRRRGGWSCRRSRR